MLAHRRDRIDYPNQSLTEKAGLVEARLRLAIQPWHSGLVPPRPLRVVPRV
jgi:hypothetical protein